MNQFLNPYTLDPVLFFDRVGECVGVARDLFFERCSEFNVIIPTKSYDGDAGWDFYVPDYGDKYALQKIHEIPPMSWKKIPLGLKMKFPQNYVFLVNDRSGLSSNEGLFTIGCVIDSGYRGEINCTIYNGSDKPYQIQPNQKLCQGLLIHCQTSKFNIPFIMEDGFISNDGTERGNKGFNSSGK